MKEVQTTVRANCGSWFTASVVRAGLALYAGFELRSTQLKPTKRGQKVVFEIAQDENLSVLLDNFARGELLVEPQAFFNAVGNIRDAVHAAKDGREFTRSTSEWLDETKQKYAQRPAMKGNNAGKESK